MKEVFVFALLIPMVRIGEKRGFTRFALVQRQVESLYQF